MPATPANTSAVQYLSVAASSGGDNALLTGVSGKVITLLHIMLQPASAVTMILKSSAGAALNGGGVAVGGAGQPTAWVDDSAWGLVQTATGEGLTLNLSSGVVVNGSVTYRLG